jgi:hypothetical protein
LNFISQTHGYPYGPAGLPVGLPITHEPTHGWVRARGPLLSHPRVGTRMRPGSPMTGPTVIACCLSRHFDNKGCEAQSGSGGNTQSSSRSRDGLEEVANSPKGYDRSIRHALSSRKRGPYVAGNQPPSESDHDTCLPLQPPSVLVCETRRTLHPLDPSPYLLLMPRICIPPPHLS